MEFVVAFLGITWARAVAAPLNSNYKQVAHGLHTCSASWFIDPAIVRMIFLTVQCTVADSPSTTPQDEFKFYLEDASSKLLIVPVGGNRNAEAAAADVGVPVATFSMPHGVCMAPPLHVN